MTLVLCPTVTSASAAFAIEKSSSAGFGSRLKRVKRCKIGTIPSVTVTSTLNVPAAFGVPLIVPVADIVSPLGSPVADQTPLPAPDPVNG